MAMCFCCSNWLHSSTEGDEQYDTGVKEGNADSAQSAFSG